MNQWLPIGATVVTTIGVVVVAYLTRRTAKDTTAIAGFDKLVDRLQEQNDRLQRQNDRQEKRIAALEKEGVERRKAEATRDRVVEVHQRWDIQVARKLRQLTEDPFPDPPPLG